MSDQFQGLSGQAVLQLNISGPLLQPKISGTLLLNQGRARLAGLINLDDLTGNFIVHNDHITSDQLNLQINEYF